MFKDTSALGSAPWFLSSLLRALRAARASNSAASSSCAFRMASSLALSLASLKKVSTHELLAKGERVECSKEGLILK